MAAISQGHPQHRPSLCVGRGAGACLCERAGVLGAAASSLAS